MNKLTITNLKLNFKNLKNLVYLVYKNKSPIRIFHNIFLESINISGNVIDLGSGYHSSYYSFLKTENTKITFADEKESDKKNFIKVDLEKKLEIGDEKYDNVILFNVLEHIVEYKHLLKEINRILKTGGKLELFVPFMHMYHQDPKDIFRPTHEYLEILLTQAGFKSKIYLIGVGPFAVCSEIILKYIKFKFLKIPLLIFFILIDKLIKIFSKDFGKYYNGIHCTCLK